MKKLIIAFAVFCALMYGTGVFYNVSFDLSRWDTMSRGCVAFVIGLAVILYSFAVALFIVDENKQKDETI